MPDHLGYVCHLLVLYRDPELALPIGSGYPLRAADPERLLCDRSAWSRRRVCDG
jgi:hypothetical protein